MEQNMQRSWIAIEGIWIAVALLAIAMLTVVGFLIVKSDQDQTARTADNRARYSACFDRQLDDGFDAPTAAQICSSLSPQQDPVRHSE
jgi:hypothetical protein